MTATITDPARALALAEVVELQAAWENAPKSLQADATAKELLAKQKTFEEYRAKTGQYDQRYRTAYVAERQPATARHLGDWCRDMGRLFVAAAAARCPAQLVEKAYRWADRVAVKDGRPGPARSAPATTADAVLALAAIERWCAGVPAPTA